MKKKSLKWMFALIGAALLSGSLLTACSEEEKNGNEGGEGGGSGESEPELNFEGSPYITQVLDYRPAPGQFVNTMPSYEEGDTQETMNAKVLSTIGNGKNGVITLGAYGGYVVVGFDHTIQNVEGEKDFRIVGNAFIGNSEPAIVMVAYDKTRMENRTLMNGMNWLAVSIIKSLRLKGMRSLISETKKTTYLLRILKTIYPMTRTALGLITRVEVAMCIKTYTMTKIISRNGLLIIR